ncbi:S-layer homology domain-containing protein [Paenibacillus sedimenti]|uniref:S-layer homology domain-containing protein n=1 Tax=Paenibacillus sedimenti TaxID=2770274 RepID=A0A926QMU1_9BACL|nr:S-layer homology domain-containing protein [Paenibacillus sedimenti]MBD0384283.1 S-layer homology domain-containing protein [Paenibacillus sedimenti]
MKSKPNRNKWISISLMIAMLIALLPPMTAFAAPVINITNYYVHTDPNDTTVVQDPTPFSDASVPRITSNPITLSADIGGISDDQIANIFYEIKNLNTGISTPNKTNRAIKNPNNSNQITFENVQLTEGLNKIVIKYGGTSTVDSKPAWIYFTPVSNITGLKINDVDFADGGMYPATGPYTNLTVTGNSNNAFQVDATVSGATYEATNFSNGIFTFLMNTGRASDLTLTPGDNQITFISKNPTNYYTAKRTFVYNNGLGFAFNGKVRFKESASSTNQALVNVPNLQSSTDNNITFTADLKNSKGNITAGSADYTYADISVAGSGASIRYNFADGTVTTTGSLNANSTAVPPVPAGTAPSLSTTAAVTPGTAYDVHHISAILPLSGTTTSQEIDVTFITSLGGQATTRYLFNYTNPNLPYLDHVAQYFAPPSAPAFEVKLSEQGTNQINEFPATLRIHTNANSNQVKVTIPGFLNNVTVPVNASGIATVVLENIPDGLTDMTIVPSSTNPTLGDNPAGTKVYKLNISSAPYVIVNNLYNGKVVSNKTQLTCGATMGPCITGKIVNLPKTGYSDVELTVNDTNIPLTVGDSSATPPTTGMIDAKDGTFTIPEASFLTLFNADGKKSIKFSLYLRPNGPAPNPKVLVTQTNYDVFVLSDFAPLIEELALDATVTPNKAGSLPGSYLTTSNRLQLTGTVLNAKLNSADPESTSILYVRSVPVGSTLTAGTTPLLAQLSQVVNPLDNNQMTTKFNITTPLTLDAYGDYVLELVAKNKTGRTTSKMITVTKQPVDYVLISPTNFVKNASNIDQANVNTNFQTVIVQADGADSIIYNKVSAKLIAPGQFRLDVPNLKAGKNTVSFEITRGTAKTKGSFVLNNLNTPIEGAQYRTTLASKMNLFGGDLQLTFPKDTKLMRNDRTQTEQFISADRNLVFGIANQDDGRVDKASETPAGTRFLQEPTGRFRPASKLFWVDGGTIDISAASTAATLKDALQGSGNLPSPSILGPGETAFYSRFIKNLVIPTERGTLTLKYDDEIRNDSWKYLSVYQFGTFIDPSGTGNQYVGWKNIGGVVDPKSHTIKVPVESFGYFQVMYMDNSFNDVTNHDWARDYLDILYSKGIMNNKTAGQFLPNDAITRGEFVTMLVNIFEIPLVNEDTTYHTNDPTNPNFQGTFADVRRGLGLSNSSSLYDFMHIEAGARAGIVRGNSNGLFLPTNSISRADAAVMIERAANMKVSTDSTKSLANLKKQFTDAADIDTYALASVEAVAKAGFIDGIENTPVEGQKKPTFSFDPKGNMTRAQAAAIANRVLKQQKKIP